jgi:hypothetical protein
MNFEIAIGLQLFDNFSRQLFQAKESLDRFNKGLGESQNRLKSLSEIMKKAFDPKAIWESSERVENFSAHKGDRSIIHFSDERTIVDRITGEVFDLEEEQ